MAAKLLSWESLGTSPIQIVTVLLPVLNLDYGSQVSFPSQCFVYLLPLLLANPLVMIRMSILSARKGNNVPGTQERFPSVNLDL